MSEQRAEAVDYYDPHARLTLDKPVALVGCPGARVALTGHALASLTGLPLVAVDRLVEHTAGRSRMLILLEHGVEVLRRLESAQLERALERRPCGIVTLPEGAPLSDAALAELRSRARLVCLRRPLEVLLENARSMPEFALAELEPELPAREAEYARAELVYDAGTTHPGRVADELIGRLDWELR